MSELYFPAGQLVHAVVGEESSSLYLPAPQMEHAHEPELEAYVPTQQLSQTLLYKLERVPAGQLVHALSEVDPLSLLNLPPVQYVQVDCPVRDWYLPALQEEQ